NEVTKVRTHCGDAPSDRRGCEAVGAHRGDPALELVERCIPDGSISERVQRCEVTPVDVGVGSTHGARPDSAGRRPLLRVTIAFAVIVTAFAVAPSVASASQLIARNTSTEQI